MKRIIGFILSLSMLLPTLSTAYAEQVNSHESYTVLCEMGLIEKAEEESMTRAEFAQLIYDIKHFADDKTEDDSWSENFFGELEIESKIIEESGKKFELFEDVDPDDSNSAAIEELVNIGVMNGVSDSEFKPEKNVKNIEIVKTILNLLGYKKMCSVSGAYPDGYMSVADALEISDGVDISLGKEASVADVARLIYNAFDVKIMRFSFENGDTGLKTDENDTMLTKIMKLDYVKGLITDNGITSLYGKSDVGENQIICANRTFVNSGDNVQKVRELLGYNVKLFYYIEGDEENSVVYVCPTKKNKVLTINIDDFESYENNVVKYEDGQNIKRAEISKNASFILNGLAITAVPKDIFEFDNGTVTLIAANDGKYETVIIKSYVSMYVGSLDSKKNIIYNKSYSTTDENYPASFSFNDAYENGTLSIKKSGSEFVGKENIVSGQIIDVAKNENVIEIIISEEKADDFQIIGTGMEDGKNIIYGNERDYEIDKAFEAAENTVEYALNDRVALYLNSFGKVVWMEKANSYNLNVGYVIRTVYDEMENDGEGACFIRLIDKEGNSLRYYCADKVRFGDSETPNPANYKKLKPEEVYKYMEGRGRGIIGYNLNDDKKIDFIELPLEKRGGENRLQLIYNSGTENIIYKNDAGGKFKDYTWTDANTRVFTIPTSEADIYNENKYSCVDKGTLFKSDGKYPVLSYGTDAEGIRAQYMVMQKEVKNTLTFQDREHQFFIVTDVREGIDENDEPAVELSGYKTSAYLGANTGLVEMTLYSKNDAGKNSKGESVNPALNAYASFDIAKDNPKLYKVKKGDIIRYSYTSEDIYPTGIEILYRADTEGDYGGAKGAILGVKDYADENSLPYNVFAFTDNGGTISNNVEDYNVCARVVYSWLYSINKEVGTVTNRDLTLFNFDPSLGLTTYVPINTGATRVTINYDKKSVSASLSKVSDYKPYKDYGKECSKILTLTVNAWTTFTFIINGEM